MDDLDSISSRKSAATSDSSCRSCTDFKSWMRQKRKKKENSGKQKNFDTVTNTASSVGLNDRISNSSNNSSSPINNGGISSSSSSSSSSSTITSTSASSSNSDSTINNASSEGSSSSSGVHDKTEGMIAPPLSTVEEEEDLRLWGLAAKHGCPADSESLGRGSWRLLHSVAAEYPQQPDMNQRADMSAFITLFSRLYPCQPCAYDFRAWLAENPLDVSSGSALSQFLCQAHNDVNRRLGKDEFDCSRVDERWKHGWPDGSCG